MALNFVPSHARLIEPLNTSERKVIHWKWSKECQTPFTESKHAIVFVSLFKPDFDKPFEVPNDASGIWLLALLIQIDNRKERKFEFASNFILLQKKDIARRS